MMETITLENGIDGDSKTVARIVLKSVKFVKIETDENGFEYDLHKVSVSKIKLHELLVILNNAAVKD